MLNSSISVIIPAYNEEKTIEKALLAVDDFLVKNFANYEIILVDDASNDNTHNIASKLSRRITNLTIIKNSRNRGKGYSVKKGVFCAGSEYIVFSDADLSTPLDELSGFMNYLNDGADIVIGSRALRDSRIMKKQIITRRTMGRVFNLLIKIFLFRGINDTQCGFKCFRARIARELFSLQRLTGFCFDAEILYLARKLKYPVKEVPVRWINREDSRVSMLGDSLQMLIDIFRIRLNDFRRHYEKK